MKDEQPFINLAKSLLQKNRVPKLTPERLASSFLSIWEHSKVSAMTIAMEARMDEEEYF